ncbi:MAG: hypothetical protein E7357_08345 [Clostridiales bacterium]|nr:hypothetical protein [Clostridiales bacterium]
MKKESVQNTVVDIASRRICLFDSSLIDKANTTAVKVFHEPIKQGFCAEFDKPWEKEGAHVNIFFDGEKWRMYYMAGARIDMERISKLDPEDTKAIQNVIDETILDGFKVCYMESKDGICWEKPNLHICEFQGSTENNIVLRKPVEFFVFKDNNPACKPNERFKAIYNLGYTLYAMYSEDGLRFEEAGAICQHGGTFDSLNTAYYDEENDRYVAYVRGMHRYDGKEYPDLEDQRELVYYLFPEFDKPESLKKYLPEYKEGEDKKKYDIRRDIRVMYSKDFKTWTRPKQISIAGNEDGKKEFYTNAIRVYPRAPQYLVGFPNRYNDDREWDKSYDELCGAKARKFRYGFQKRFGLAITDSLFISSNDGEYFEVSDGAFLRPGVEREDGWLYGDSSIACGLVETKNAIYGHKEYSLYCVEGHWGHKCRLMRYAIRLDGFVSYCAREEEKIITTKPFRFQGDKLFMNFSTSALGYVQVVLTDESGNRLQSAKVFGDDTDKEVWFVDENALKSWQGKNVTMQIIVREADVYSYRFADCR